MNQNGETSAKPIKTIRNKGLKLWSLENILTEHEGKKCVLQGQNKILKPKHGQPLEPMI